MRYGELVDCMRYKNIENDKIFVPNEIFKDFVKIEGNVSNKSFCYSFYYLIMYLYRFTKYGSKTYSVQDLKEMLGYSPTNKTMDKFIKKNGILEKMGYLSHTTNYPTMWTYDKDERTPVFRYYEDFINEHTREEIQYFRKHMGLFLDRKNTTIKVPVKGLYRNLESLKDNNKDGVFFYVENTTRIDVETFLFCMSNKDLETNGFWVYSFIKYMNEYYDGDWNVSQVDMGRLIGVSNRQLNRVLDSLESHNMIYNDHKPYVVGLPSDIKLKGCSYKVKNSDNFHFSYKSVRKREVIMFATWCHENDIDYDEYVKSGVIKKVDGYDKNPFEYNENEDNDLSWIQE